MKRWRKEGEGERSGNIRIPERIIVGEPTILSKAEAIHNNINRQRNNSDPIATILVEPPNQNPEYASQ